MQMRNWLIQLKSLKLFIRDFVDLTDQKYWSKSSFGSCKWLSGETFLGSKSVDEDIASVLNDIKLFSLDFEHLNYLGCHATRVCFQSLVWQSSRSFRAVLSSLIPASLALDQSCNIWVIFSTCVVNQWSWLCIVVDDSPFIGVSLMLGGFWFTDLLIERSGYEPSEPSQGLCCDLRQDTLQKTVDGY